jgi:hypothetical protein
VGGAPQQEGVVQLPGASRGCSCGLQAVGMCDDHTHNTCRWWTWGRAAPCAVNAARPTSTPSCAGLATASPSPATSAPTATPAQTPTSATSGLTAGAGTRVGLARCSAAPLF